jgi:hypothetical protein
MFETSSVKIPHAYVYILQLFTVGKEINVRLRKPINGVQYVQCWWFVNYRNNDRFCIDKRAILLPHFRLHFE